MHLVLRRGDQLAKPRPVDLELPDGTAIGRATMIGRGDSVHILNERGWFRARLAGLEAAAARDAPM